MTYQPDANTFGLYNCEGTGSVLIDSSSFLNHAVMGGFFYGRQKPGAFGYSVRTVFNDYLDLSAAAGDWDVDLGMVDLYFKPQANNLWTDGVQHTIFDARVDASNRWTISKSAGNILFFENARGGITSSINAGSFPTARPWVHLAMAWSKAADQFWAWVNGVVAGLSPVTGLGVFSGTLAEILVGVQSGVLFETKGYYDRIRFRDDFQPEARMFDLRGSGAGGWDLGYALDAPGAKDFQADLKQEVLGL